ncbi:hypothetical protein KL942_004238 [Ogataea angusta]|uniref:Vacuolar segregation protein 7 n=1 Tax=Pichia angusta TaxID=870730 RepID=A0ABQ7RTB3_PICAN|nr:hypothetical protein KL943_004421 [Ogataea angusta]KAG7837826.1 hypothetical protein KL942_004238 [Ogataea angusta]KAG7847276.1 hypothetical protein KL940_004022 [Ogataea angusta]KAG7856054.1 hypothetical protein KL919_004447 [Ogataea angusta]KAG7856921.1 hypothetical protein KL939_003706 [Ogataea angusta]
MLPSKQTEAPPSRAPFSSAQRVGSGGSDTDGRRNITPESKGLAAKQDAKNKNTKSSMVAVVQEQAQNPNLVHILPVSSVSNTVGSGTTSATTGSGSGSSVAGNGTMGSSASASVSRQVSSADITKTASPTTVNGASDSFMTHLKSKRSVIDGPVLEDGLRPKKGGAASSLMNLRNANTVSSTSTIQSKASSRAEFFAAKLHDAIKVDDKNSSDSEETFVYDTSANDRPGEPETANDETLTAQQTINDGVRDREAPAATVVRLEDAPSETGSNRSEHNFNTTTSQDRAEVQDRAQSKSPLPRAEDRNQLRQITSRVFDSKGVIPRRYSGMNYEIDDLEDNYPAPQVNEPDLYSDSGDDASLSEHAYNNNYGSISSDGYLSNFQNGIYLQQPFLESRNNKMGGSKLKRKPKNLYFSPHDFTGAREVRIRQIKSFCYTIGLILVLLSVGFMSGFILATTKELQHTQIDAISDVLISQEELVFSMEVESFNPGFLSITIQDANIDVFARSQYVDAEEADRKKKTRPVSTILLGTVTSLDVPLHFQGGFFNRQLDWSMTEIKIKNPCSFDDSGEIKILEPSEKWLNISKNPFDLIIRGVLSYQLPISTSNQTVSVSRTFEVNPEDLEGPIPGTKE